MENSPAAQTDTHTPSPSAAKYFFWGLILLPVFLGMFLVHKNWMNQRFLDDWLWTQDTVKYGRGELHFLDLFEVHMEHRAGIARGLAVIITAMAHGDVRAQVAVTFVMILGTYLGICWLFLKRGGVSLAAGCLPLMLVGGVMFSPVQWQNLLWPCCSGTVAPLFFLGISMCIAASDWPWWARSLGGALCATLATLSFAAGISLWFLPLPVMFFCGRWKKMGERWLLLATWIVAVSAVLFPYFHHFVNAVPKQYAYGHGEENTLKGALPYFLSNPLADLNFVTTFCGAMLARGLAVDTLPMATLIGAMLLLGYAAACAYLLRNWKDEKLRAGLLPVLCLASYSIVAALMVAVGRIYAGGVGSGMNMRYTVHQTLLPAMLVLAVIIISRHWGLNRPVALSQRVRLAGWLSGGLLAGFLIPGWFYGAAMMAQWKTSRCRDAGSQMVSQLFKFSRCVGLIAGNFGIAQETCDSLDKLKLLPHPLLRDPKLSHFNKATHWLDDRHGEVKYLRKEANGWTTKGYSLLPGSWRPADAIFFAYKVEGGEWTIFGMTQPQGIPNFLNKSMGKDVQYIIHGRTPWPGQLLSGWGENLDMISDPPPGAKITAWALDAERMQVHLVSHGGFSEAKVAEGFTLEELAGGSEMADQ